MVAWKFSSDKPRVLALLLWQEEQCSRKMGLMWSSYVIFAGSWAQSEEAQATAKTGAKARLATAVINGFVSMRIGYLQRLVSA
jgi:hypothetical protein